MLFRLNNACLNLQIMFSIARISPEQADLDFWGNYPMRCDFSVEFWLLSKCLVGNSFVVDVVQIWPVVKTHRLKNQTFLECQHQYHFIKLIHMQIFETYGINKPRNKTSNLTSPALLYHALQVICLYSRIEYNEFDQS